MKLVTIAVFYDPYQARIALNFLESEGIRAALENETIVSNDWTLGQAVGNVRLNVADYDVEQSLAALGEHSSIEPSELDALALAAKPEETAKPIFKFFYPEGTDEENGITSGVSTANPNTELVYGTEDVEPNAKEFLVDRAFRGSIMMFVALYLVPFVTILLFQILVSKETLRSKYKRKLIWSLIFHVPVLLFYLEVLLLLLFFTRHLYRHSTF